MSRCYGERWRQSYNQRHNDVLAVHPVDRRAARTSRCSPSQRTSRRYRQLLLAYRHRGVGQVCRFQRPVLCRRRHDRTGRRLQEPRHVTARSERKCAELHGPFSGTTRVSRYRNGKTNLDFTEARDSEWQWHQLGRMQVCPSLQTDNQASTPPQAGCPSCHPTNSVKALKAH